jgi:hypothetical protein
VASAVETGVRLLWTGPLRLEVSIPEVQLEWQVDFRATPATWLMNLAMRVLPERAWESEAVLRMMGRMAGPILGVGQVSLHGFAPNGQHFRANPRQLWAVAGTRARIGDVDLGEPGSVSPQARLGDFWIPQRGLLAIGQTYFDTFDSQRHSSAVCSLGKTL